MTRDQIKAEVNRRLAAGEISAAEHAAFMRDMAALDAKSAPKLIPHEIIAQFNTAAPRLDSLAARWSDEQEYEDWADYDKAVRAMFPAPFVVSKVTKRPFAVTFTHPSDGRAFTIKVGRKISLTSR